MAEGAAATYPLAGFGSFVGSSSSSSQAKRPRRDAERRVALHAKPQTKADFSETAEQARARRSVSLLSLMVGLAFSAALYAWTPNQTAAVLSETAHTASSVGAITDGSAQESTLTQHLNTLVKAAHDFSVVSEELASTPERLKNQAVAAGIPEPLATQAAADTPELIPLALEDLDNLQSACGISAWAPAKYATSQAFKKLDKTVANYTAQGRNLSFYLVNLRTGRSLSFGADEPRYPASSIKAALACMVFQSDAAARSEISSRTQELVSEMLIDSDNKAFSRLIDNYGSNNFSQWMSGFAPEAASRIKSWWNYPDISPREMACIWQEIYRYAKSDELGGELLGKLLEQTNYSALGELLREDYVVWSKPGWYFEDQYAPSATNDTGIVFSETGPYIAVVFSDAPEDFESLMPVLEALHEAHAML